MEKKKILFLCTKNSCRSQMAEGLARKILNPEEFEIFSAGTEPFFVDPLAIKVLAEIGVDISGQRSKSIEELGDKDFHTVITLCDRAKESCPLWLGKAKKVMHRSFEDPQELAKGAKTEEEALSYYRKVRDAIKRFIEELEL